MSIKVQVCFYFSLPIFKYVCNYCNLILIFLIPLLFLFSCGKGELNKSDEAEIKSWKFGDKLAIINGTDITITLSYGTDITALQSDVELSAGASISPDPANSKDYTNAVTFRVTSEDGNTINEYKVVVSVEDPIISWTAGWRDDDAYAANINHSIGKVDIDVNSADFDMRVTLLGGVSISPDPNSITDWTDEVTFTITKGLKTKTYKVKVKVDGKDIIKVTNTNIKNTIEDEIAKYGNTANYNYIDVSSVTNMQELFNDKTNFNGDISKWDVSKVINMKWMFTQAEAFNQDIRGWNVSNVKYMVGMFRLAKVFNQDIGDWDVSAVTTMESMFNEARVFNQDIGEWDVSNVDTMDYMFTKAKAFNQDIGEWKVSGVTTMKSMFTKAEAFNQDIGEWDVSNVTYMFGMFGFAKAFNQDISKWDVSNVIDMVGMFSSAKAFNQDISNWKVDKVTNCKMFSDNSGLDKNNKPKFTCLE